MKIVTLRNLNLHSKSTPGGLVHVPKRRATLVPNDVTEMSTFAALVKSGEVRILNSKVEPSVPKAVDVEPPTPETPSIPPIEDEEPEIVDETGVEDEEESEEK